MFWINVVNIWSVWNALCAVYSLHTSLVCYWRQIPLVVSRHCSGIRAVVYLLLVEWCLVWLRNDCLSVVVIPRRVWSWWNQYEAVRAVMSESSYSKDLCFCLFQLPAASFPVVVKMGHAYAGMGKVCHHTVLCSDWSVGFVFSYWSYVLLWMININKALTVRIAWPQWPLWTRAHHPLITSW